MNPEAFPSHGSETDESVLGHEVTDRETIAQVELDEVINNPENVGLNLTDAHLTIPSRMEVLAGAHSLINEVGEDVAFDQLAKQYGMSPTEVRETYARLVDIEAGKTAKLREMLDRLPDGVSLRVHPYPPNSPFSIEQSRHSVDGVDYYSFDPSALEQLQMVLDKVRSGETPGDLTVVMSSYTAERNSNTPETPEDIDACAEMCIAFLKEMGLEESGGEGVCLELGNETNVDRNTRNHRGQLMFDRPGFTEHADPVKYAHMYSRVAAKIKERFPQVRLAIAGTAMFDEDYLWTVIETVLSDSGGDKSLIDKISFHPYRDTLEKGSPTFQDGVCVPSDLSYEEQLERMSALAAATDAEFDVGEISFSRKHGVSVDLSELHRNSAFSREHGLKSYTWPEGEILDYEAPEQ